MRKYLYLSLITLMLAACGEDKVPTVEELIAAGNIEAIAAQKDALQTEANALNEKIKQLNAYIKDNSGDKGKALVTVLAVKDTLFNHYVELQGNVTTKQNVIVYPEYSGTMTRVYVKEGDRVRKGQLLANIDDGGLSSQLAQLEGNAALAKTTYERQERLWNQQIGSEIQFLQAKTNYESASDAVNQLRKQLGKTRVTAPFTGTIDQVATEQGTVVGPGIALFRVVNLSDMYITADVPEKYISQVTKGKKVAIELPVLGETLNSSVRTTGNYINPSNRTYMIEVDVPNKDGMVKPNLTARLKINDYTNENAMLIPLSVISEDASGEQYVYTAFAKADSKSPVAKRTIIKTGRAQGDYIEVLEGLKAGDQIIVEGARSVKEDQEIKILDY